MFRYVHWFSFNIHHRQAWKPFGFFFRNSLSKCHRMHFRLCFCLRWVMHVDSCRCMLLHIGYIDIVYCVLLFVCLFRIQWAHLVDYWRKSKTYQSIASMVIMCNRRCFSFRIVTPIIWLVWETIRMVFQARYMLVPWQRLLLVDCFLVSRTFDASPLAVSWCTI